MPLKSYEKHLLTEKWMESVKDFDCCKTKNDNYEKLNNFIKKDALNYNRNNLSRTTIYIKNGICIAYYSLAMNAIFEPRIKIEENLKSYPALFLTRFAVDKNYQKSGIGKAIITDIIKHAFEDQEVAAMLLFLDAYPETISWYLNNPQFEILYTALGDRIEDFCEKYVIERLNKCLKQGCIIEFELKQDMDIDSIRSDCERILTLHTKNIFKNLASENSLLDKCNSKIKLYFENNRPKIKLENFVTRNNITKIRDWLKNKNNILNIDITIPVYANINGYYRAVFGDNNINSYL